ncbi:LysM peptidoglycan-binding domain-containing protein [bacterium]|nr:LysM peptidoglycan-binding domain-containing protein [bacterium]
MKRFNLLRVFILCLFCMAGFPGVYTDAARNSLTAEEVQARLGEEIGSINRKIINLEEIIGLLNERADISAAKSSDSETGLKDSLKKIADEVIALKKEVEKLNLLYSGLEKELDDKINAVIDEVASENEEIRKEIKAIKTAKGFRAGSTGDAHIVKSGETLSAIAKLYGVTIVSLMEANNMDDPNMIKIGDELIIPGQ